MNDPTKLGTINAIQLSDFKDLSNNISNNNNNSNKISNYNNSNNNVGYNSSNYNNSDNSNQNSYSNYRGRGRGSYRGYRGRGRGGYRGGRGRGRGGYRGGRGRGRRTSYRSGRRTRVKMPYYAKNTCDKCNIWGHWESQCEWITKDHPQLKEAFASYEKTHNSEYKSGSVNNLSQSKKKEKKKDKQKDKDKFYQTGQ